jgi:hypothetical protein
MIPTRPNIFVLCMHKAASTFVADVLLPSIAIRTGEYNLFNVGSMLIRYREQEQAATGEVPKWVAESQYDQLMRCFGEKPLPKSNGVIGRVYPGHLKAIEQSLGIKLPDAGNRLVIVRRDPRDALVSLYYSLTVSHNPTRIEGDQAYFKKNREQLQSQSVREGIKSILSSTGTDVTSGEFLRCTQLLRDNPDACDLPYELLMNHPRQWLTRFVEFGQLEKYVDAEWLSVMLSHLQPPEVEDPTSHKRRMRPGNWIEVFDDELRAMLEEKIGNRMQEFGYHWNDEPSTSMRRAS